MTENHPSVAQQFDSLAEVVDEHSNLLRSKPDDADWHVNNAEHVVLSPGKTNKEIEDALEECKTHLKTLQADLEELASQRPL